MKNTGKLKRGFAVMKKEDVLRICAMGGEACMKKPGHAQEIGRKGGLNSHRGDSARRKLVVSKRKG